MEAKALISHMIVLIVVALLYFFFALQVEGYEYYLESLGSRNCNFKLVSVCLIGLYIDMSARGSL